MKIPARPTVILRRCETYDVDKIRGIVRDGLTTLNLTPQGKCLIKPNCVASGELFPHAYTRPEFLEGVALAMRDVGGTSIGELAFGERCGITIPTRRAFAEAGYYPMFERAGARHYHFEEEPQVEIPLTHPQRLRDYVFTPAPVAQADFFVNCPKFKSHPWTTVTFSMKNYIGIQDDRHRLIDHDHRLDDKIADLQHIVQPAFIAIDAITAGEGRMLTPLPFDLGLVIMGNAQVAFDVVCCHIIGVDPATVPHIRLASEHGFGSLRLEDIQIEGDITLAQAQERARGFKVGLVRVENYFEGTSITAYAGPPPEREYTDYCWGGCPGALEEAIEILRLYDKQCDAKMPRMHIVFGAYEGPIHAGPGEKIIFIGDCAHYEGSVGGNVIRIENLYRDRSLRDPHHAEHHDIFGKMLTVTRELVGSGDVIRLQGCPVSVAEQVLALVAVGGLDNPYLSASEMPKFLKGYLAWRGRTTLDRMRGKPYQVKGAAERGEAKPKL